MKVVAMMMPAESGGALDEDLKIAFGANWEVSSVVKATGSLGLPVRGEIAFRFVRAVGRTDPAQFLGRLQAGSVVPMSILLETVKPSLEQGWKLLCADGKTPTKTTVIQPLQSVIDFVSKTGGLPACDLDQYGFPDAEWNELSSAQMRRAVVLLSWAVFAKTAEGACCDLDDATGPIFLGGALPNTGGLKMFIVFPAYSAEQPSPAGLCRTAGPVSLAVKTLTPYHVLAARGYAPPGRVNLSTLAPRTAHRAAGAAMPTTAAVACVLACMQASM